MNSNAQKRILIAPLDWGLGHTTRCMPLIRFLLESGHLPVFGGNDWQRHYITETFPAIETIHLDGYNIRYSRYKTAFMFSLLLQVPGIIGAIRKEHAWLADIVVQKNIDGIISDNRYGLFHQKIPSVIVTHQLLVQSGLGDAADRMLQKIHYRYLNRFDECWIADVDDKNNLSGKLGHPEVLPAHAQYIGLLSQMDKDNTVSEGTPLLVLLSGPEPQRSILSSILWRQLQAYTGAVVFVEGSDKVPAKDFIPPHISYHKRLTKKDLLPLLRQASLVICRSGYSTLMDLAALGKKAIVIPTPGQTEQEYLAKTVHEKGIFFKASQKNFTLKKLWEDVQQFPFRKPFSAYQFEIYKTALTSRVARL